MVGSWKDAAQGVKRAVVSAALAGTTSVYDEWSVMTGETRIPLDSRRAILFEMVAFYLHATKRFAAAAGGPERQATLYNAVAGDSIREVFSASSGGHVPHKGLEGMEWEEWMAEDMLMLVNGADRDYSQRKELTSSSGLSPFVSDTAVGRLGARILRQVGREENVPLRLFLWNTALGGLSKLQLKERVEEACRALGQDSY